jgi:hypothetical protein
MRAADFLNQSMVEDIMGEMHPDSNSIECIMLQEVPGVNRFKQVGGKDINPFILAEVTNPNAFAFLEHGSIVLVPKNNCHFLPTKDPYRRGGIWFRFFINQKHVKGIAHNAGKWDISEANRHGSE